MTVKGNFNSHGPYVNVICTNCNKKHVRLWKIADGFGNCNSCDGPLVRRNTRSKSQDAKAKQELKELEKCH